MAANRTNASALVNAPPTAAQVEDRVATVNRVYERALDEVSGTLGWQSDAEKTSEGQIRQRRGDVDNWIVAGRDAARLSKKPYPSNPKGWGAWTDLGNVFNGQFENIAKIGDHATLSAITETVKEAPQTTAKAIRDAGVVINQAGSNVAMGMLKPLLIGVAAYVFLTKVVLR